MALLSLLAMILSIPTDMAKLGKTQRRKTAKKKVSKAARGTGRPGPLTDRKAVQETFLAAFVETGTVTAGCKAAGVSRDIHYYWLKNHEDYREAFYAAEEELADALEVEARRRAVEGVEEPVGFYMGEHGGTFVQKYSDTLLRFLLEGRRSSVFKHRHEVTGSGGGPLIITQIDRVIVDPAKEENIE